MTVINPGSGYVAGQQYEFKITTDNDAVFVTGGGGLKTLAANTPIVYLTQGGSGGGAGDPHLTFDEGGYADFRGKHNTFYSILNVPGFQFAAKSVNTSFLLPRPQLVHGTFFTDVAYRARGDSGDEYGFALSAEKVEFHVFKLSHDELSRENPIATRRGIWQQWWEDGIRMYTKQATLYIRANGWEVNTTRKPIYDYVSGPNQWRFDFTVRSLNDTTFAKFHKSASGTCFPHGIIGQSYDGDGVGISGRTDDYAYNKSHPVITTTAMAEGAIEGTAVEYALPDRFSTNFKYDRFSRQMNDTCPARDTRLLTGPRVRAKKNAVVGVVE